MGQITSKFTNSSENPFGGVTTTGIPNFKVGRVVTVGKKSINKSSKPRLKGDEKFNSDQHCIRVRIPGEEYDKEILDDDLPNCFPLLPKHLNFIPEEGEEVLVIVPDKNLKKNDRYYIGPFISTETKLGGDYQNSTSSANKIAGISEPGEEISKITSANGLYENPKHVTIDGRENTDIIQRNGEVIIRAGKYVDSNRLLFNNVNPGVFQIKYNQNFNEKELNNFGLGTIDSASETEPKNVTVTNIISDKINFLTHKGDEDYNITHVDEKSEGAAQYISDDEMDKILNNAHPLVFGDILIKYLKLLKEAFLTHRHQINNQPSKVDGTPIKDFINKADDLEKAMLSKNIRIN